MSESRLVPLCSARCPGKLRMTGALALGPSPGLTAEAGIPTGCAEERHTGRRSQRMGPVGGLWLSWGDSDTGTLGGGGSTVRSPPPSLWESQPLSPSPTRLSCCPSASHPRAFARAAPHVLHVCSRLPPPISPSLPVTAPLSPVTVSPITLWPGGDSASVYGASWHRVGMGVRFPPTASRAEGVG